MDNYEQILFSPEDLATRWLDYMRAKFDRSIPTTGPCVICGSETVDRRMGTNGEGDWLCLYDTGDGLACYEVWQNRQERADLPTREQFIDNNRQCILDGYASTDPNDYDLLEVPWRDDRDEYHDYETYIKSREWNIKAWRAKVLAGWRCERCGRYGSFSQLDAHHKHYRTLFKERRQDVEVLCRHCHRAEHGKLR